MTEPDPFKQAFDRICAMEAPLRERLALLTAAVELHSKPFADEYAALVKQLQKASAGQSAPAIGEPMPHFLLPDHEGRLVSMQEKLDAGPLVVSFNRGHWCEYCQLELQAFAEAHAEFAARGAQVVSVMPEGRSYTRQLRARARDSITVLSDIDNGYALELGLVIWLGAGVERLYRECGLDIERYQGNGSWFVPIPATFVIGRDGLILDRKVDPDFRDRMDIGDVIRALDAARSAPHQR